MNQPTIQTIPLDSLRLSPNNPRKTGGADVSDLMASIEAEGLLNNLVVSAGDNGTYMVEDGGRRLRALQRLREDGRLQDPLVDAVPCRVVEADNGLEAGMHATLIREALHPADEFVAFQQLIEQGRSIAEIAERFGKPERHVLQRLKLAKVRPEYLQMYRDKQMSLQQLEALASTDNHELQRQAWTTARGDWDRTPERLRAYLARDTLSADAPLVEFVGLEAYEAAGGRVRRDLFTDDAWVLDLKLLDTLAMDRLEAEAQKLRDAGWSFVDVVLPNSGTSIYDYGQHPRAYEAEDRFAAEDDASRWDTLTARQVEIEDIDADELDDEEAEKLRGELSRIESELSEPSDRRIEIHTPEVMAQSGAVLYVNSDGMQVRLAYLKPGQKPGQATPTAGKSGNKPKAKPADFSQAVLTELSAHRSLAAAVSLRYDSDLAVSMLIDALLGAHNGVGVRTVIPSDHKACAKDANKGSLSELAEVRKHLAATIPTKNRLEFLLKQSATWREEVLAMITALHFDGIVHSNKPHPGVDAIHSVAKFDMTDSWYPTCDDFLSRIHADLRTQAVAEACGKDAVATLAGLKKAEHAAATAKLLAGTGWLPKPLRGPGYALKKAGEKPAAKGKAKPPAKSPAKKAAKKAPAKKAAKKSKGGA